MRSFDPPATPESAKRAFSGSFLDVSERGFARHGREAFGLLKNPATVLAVKTHLCSLCLLEMMYDNEQLGMCGIDLKHTEDDFIRASMKIEAILREECPTLRYDVPTWDGDVISFLRPDVEGLWWSNLPESGNVIRLVGRPLGARLLGQGRL